METVFSFVGSRFFRGKPTPGTDIKDIAWLKPDGTERGGEEDWHLPGDRCLSFVLSGEAGIYHVTLDGTTEPDDTFFVVMNANHEALQHAMPKFQASGAWKLVIDTNDAEGNGDGRELKPNEAFMSGPHSLAVFVFVP